jgi:hypothetical protein
MKAPRKTSRAEHEVMGMSVDEFAIRNGISRAQGWREVAARRLIARKVGTRTIITKEDETAWRLALPKRNGSTAQRQHKSPPWLVDACRKPEPPPPPPPRSHRPPLAGDATPYGLKALEKECDKIRNAPFGQQEITLNNAALKIGGLVAAGEVAEEYALAELIAAGNAMSSESGREPWRRAEIEKKVRRGLKDGKRAPRNVPAEEARNYASEEAKAADHTRPCLLPTIELRPSESERIVDEIEAALLASGRGLYRRGGLVVAAGFDRMQTWDGKTVVIDIIEERGDYALLEDFEATAEFVKFDKRAKKLVRCSPGLGLAHTFKQRRTRLRLPNLVGIVNCPTIRANGELVTTPGFDAATGILFDPLSVDFPPAPQNPTRAMAEAALARVKRLLRTFPFESDHDRAVALSLFLTAIVRVFLPSAPFHGFDAPVADAKKSLIVDIASILAVGHEAGVTAQGETREEAEKRLSTLLMRGDRLIAIDIASVQLKAISSIRP